MKVQVRQSYFILIEIRQTSNCLEQRAARDWHYKTAKVWVKFGGRLKMFYILIGLVVYRAVCAIHFSKSLICPLKMCEFYSLWSYIRFFYLGLYFWIYVLELQEITADGDCSHEIKRCVLIGRKVMTNLDSMLKSRDITLPIKLCLVKAMVFPVVMYGCESWP